MKFAKIFKFTGGIHPPDEKKATAGKKIIEHGAPKKAVIPLSMSAGKQAKPIVSIGERVLRYQKIAEADGNFSLPVHSSISGIVKDICHYMHPLYSTPVLSVIIDSDLLDEPLVIKKSGVEYFRRSGAELLAKIKEAGVCGLGGAAFPTHIKLFPPKDKDIKLLIANGCECEPMLTADSALMEENAKEIIEGLKIAMHILEADRAVIAIEDNKKKAIKRMTEEVSVIPNIDIAVLKTRYPQGAEKQLIKALLDKEVSSDCLPCDANAVVINVATCFAIKQAIVDEIPLIERVITVAGDNVFNPANLRVRVGTLIDDILKFCEYDGKASKLILGGPMMGIALPNQYLPVVKGATAILTFGSDRVNVSASNECIMCGKCVAVCPVRLFPLMIYKLTQKGKFTYLPGENVSDCIECGSCSYVCPSKLYLVQTIRYAKSVVREAYKKSGEKAV